MIVHSNSAMDFFQTLCILTGRVKSSGCDAIPGWESCRQNLNACTAPQMEKMIGFEEDFLARFKGVAARSSAASGAFLYSCHNHCAGDSALFGRVTVGGRTMSSELVRWWDGGATNGSSAALGFSYDAPCIWLASGAERRCNPTCYTAGDGVP